MAANDKKAKKQATKAAAKNTAVTSSLSKKYPVALWGVLAAVFVVFLPALSNDFVNWDDPKYVINNVIIKDLSGKGLKNIFTAFYGGNYHPLTALSNAIEFKLFGLKAAPFHFFNLVFHLLNTFLVFRLIRLLCNDVRVALLVSLLFGIHPMHVESVAWISERKDVLYTLFYLLATIKYIEFRQQEKMQVREYAIVLGLFLCSLMSKSAAVVFPLTLLLVDYFMGRKISVAFVVDKIPFFILSLIFGLVALRSQKEDGAMTDLDVFFTSVDRIFLISYSFVFYIIKLVLPFKLSAFHAYPDKVADMLPWYYYTAPLVLLLLAFITLKVKRFRKELVFGFLFFVVNVILVIQLVPVGQAIVSERYSYMPYIGLFFIVAIALFYWWDMFPSSKTIIQYGGIGFLLLFGAITFGRTKVWKDGITLWNDVVAQYPKVAFAHYNLGNAYKNVSDFKSAIKAYSGAVKADSTYNMAYFNRAHAYSDILQHQQAIDDYSMAIKLKADNQEAYYNRAVSEAALKLYDAAIADYTVSLQLKPNDATVYYSRGNMKAFKGNFEEAIPDYTKAIEFDPKMADAYNNRGNCKLNLLRMPEACEDWNISLSMGNKSSEDMIKNYCNK